MVNPVPFKRMHHGSLQNRHIIAPSKSYHSISQALLRHAKLFDVRLFARNQSERDDSRNMHLGPVDVHVQLELLTDSFDVLETFLVIGTSTANPDLYLVFVQDCGNFTQRTNYAFEGRGNLVIESVQALLEVGQGTYIGKVGDTASNEQNFALWV